MSDTINKKSILNVELPKSVDNALQNLTDKPTLNAGQTIADLWFLVFGGVTQAAEKKKLKYAHELSLFKDDLDHEISLIPEKNKIDPKLQIVGPALENAKYCIESEELRNMFSKLISSSMNIDLENFVHPSFGEIIKQLSPLDAKVLKLVIKNSVNPLINVKKAESSGGFNSLCKNLTLIDIAEHGLISNSLENLCRFNLIAIPYGEYYNAEAHYDKVRNTAMYIELVSNPQKRFGYQIQEDKSYIEKTSFGLSFAKACMRI